MAFPDFIIGGAPKCGTTSLHRMLARHSGIEIPDQEIFYFDADDPAVHADFPIRGIHDLTWYARQFDGLGAEALIGEDSTTYLLSDVAPGRIKKLLPEVKLIFLLRDPVERAYSQYWHLVASGRCTHRFEKAIRTQPFILNGSTYAPRLARYFSIFCKEQVLVLLFEDLVSDPQAVAATVTDFLGVSRMSVNKDDAWHNRTRYPRSLRAQLFKNHAAKHVARMRDRRHGRPGIVTRAANVYLKRINRMGMGGAYRPMTQQVRDELSSYLSECNAGLSRLLGRKFDDCWPSFTEDGTALSE